MDGMIDRDGRLCIIRRGIYRGSKCKLGAGDQAGRYGDCEDECSLFGEPKISVLGTKLQLCKRTLVFENFKDERE